MLRSKKHNTQEEWLKAYEEIKKFANTEEGKRRAEKLIEKASSRIPKEGKIIYGWSGGKDSLALEVICDRLGIEDCVLCTTGFRWEYPNFKKYISENAPKKLFIVDWNIDVDFLNSHSKYVFPKTSADIYYWYKYNQRGWKKYATEVNADYILLGQRNQDGNNTKRKDKREICPIYDFTHEDIFLLIIYGNKKLAPFYFEKDGFNRGTARWIEEHDIKDVYLKDKSVIYDNQIIEKVRKFLEEMK